MHQGGLRRYSGCPVCFIPREFCNKWDVNQAGDWAAIEGQQCRFRGLLATTVVLYLFAAGARWEGRTRKIQALLSRRGYNAQPFFRREPPGIVPEFKRQFWELLGQKERVAGYELNYLALVFLCLTVKNR